MKGILFSAAMVRVLLNTKPNVWPAEPIDPSKPFKWQTRRLFKPIKDPNFGCELGATELSEKDFAYAPYPASTKLYVKETFMPDPYVGPNIIYKATEPDPDRYEGHNWKPSIFMPRSGSRIHLEVVRVRVQRVQEITEQDAAAEGALGWWNSLSFEQQAEIYSGESGPRGAFRDLWGTINGIDSWKQNPYVWVYDVKRTK